MSDRIPASTHAAGELGPIGEEETTVLELVRWVHDVACSLNGAHDPLCNTARLLADDQAHLARVQAESRRVALVAAGALAEKHNALVGQQ